MPPRVRTAAAAAVTVIALIGSAVVFPASAVAPGVLGAKRAVSNGSSVPDGGVAPAVATLPSGATAIAWSGASGAALYLRVRAPGSTTWGALKHYVPSGGYQISGDVYQTVVNLFPLGSSTFLLVWTEKNGSNYRVQAARVAAAAATISPAVISGSETDSAAVWVSVNAAGRAVVVWRKSATQAARIAVLANPTSAWSAAATLATSNVDFPQVAVASNGTFCVQWTAPVSGATIKLTARCRTSATPPTSPATWVTGLPPAKVIATADIVGLAPWSSIAASGNSFTSALSRRVSGTAPVAGAPFASRIALFSLPSAAGTWSSAHLVGPDAQMLLQPVLGGSADGRAVLTYKRLEGSVGSTSISNAASFETYVVDRGTTGSWSQPVLVAAAAIAVSSVTELFITAAVAFGPNGSLVVGGIQSSAGLAPMGITFASTVRAGWGLPVSQSVSWVLPGAFSAATIAPSGRTTIAVVDISPAGGIVERTTAMPKPFLLSRAKLSKAPKKGVPVACSSAWTDAASRTFTWLRNGSVIGGATSSTYKPTGADQGKGLSCRVKAVNPTGSSISGSLERTVA
ncbi:MAG: hypothetical protein WCP26_06975 [Actinomycetes bacterium]